MAGARDLVLGFVEQGSVYDKVVEEMLDHQGVCYRIVEAGAETRFPLVILSERDDEAAREASGHLSTDGKITVAAEVVDLPRVLKCLAGREDGQHDRLDLFVNGQEETLMKTLEEAMSELGLPLVVKDFWPGGAPACLILTHDIDWLTYSPFHKTVVRSDRSPGRLLKLLLGGLSRRNYGWNVPTIVETQRKYGYRSTVFFRTEYSGGRELIPESVRLLRAEGYELGLHGAHMSHADPDALRDELNSLSSTTGIKASGIRHHILKFSVPETWVSEAQLGLRYDATFAYNKFFGFRGEVCYPYHPVSSSRIEIVELPTSFMDWTGLHRGMSDREMSLMLTNISQRVERYHGVFVVNLHNTYLNRATFPGMVRLYEDLLRMASEGAYWVTTAKECVDWWEARASTKPAITYEGGRVKVKSDVPVRTRGKEKIAFEYA